ncbi:MAG: hypothetical protein V3R66_02040 [Rhodospirillales bacterium]
MKLRMYPLAAFFMALLIWAPADSQSGPEPAPNTPKFQGGQSGLPLSYFCNHVPDLSVNRTDGVDNWVRICTVYFSARSNRPKGFAPPAPGPQPDGQGTAPPRP